MTTTLIPNLGAEEGPRWREHLELPDVENAAWLWRLLFGPDVEVPDCPTLEDAGQQQGLVIQKPAFRWLDPDAKWASWMLTSQLASELASDLPDSALPCSPESVWRTHDKAFAVGVVDNEKLDPKPWRGLTTVLTPDSLSDPDAAIRHISEASDRWPEWTRAQGSELLLKPRWGTSGRGRVRVRTDEAGLDTLRGNFPRLAAAGGAVLEPWTPPVREYSVQLRVDPDGTLVMVGSLEPILSAHGVVRGHRGEVDSRRRVTSARRVDESVREDAAAVARAARDQGFVGVCGVDGFTFQAEDREHTRTVVEFNARFTMGTVAVGLVRRAVPLLKRELDLQPGQRHAFVLLLDAPEAGWTAVVEGCQGPCLLVPLWREAAPRRPALLFARDPDVLDAALDGTI